MPQNRRIFAVSQGSSLSNAMRIIAPILEQTLPAISAFQCHEDCDTDLRFLKLDLETASKLNRLLALCLWAVFHLLAIFLLAFSACCAIARLIVSKLTIGIYAKSSAVYSPLLYFAMLIIAPLKSSYTCRAAK